MPVRIIPFEPQYAPLFRDLNMAWLTTYFYAEPKDIELLEACEQSIIDKGGYIFFAAIDKEIIGCYSLIQLNEQEYELGKMAVDPNFQGQKIGHQLLEHAIGFGITMNWKKIILYSNTLLTPAIHLYKKYGFREITMEDPAPYARSNIKMALILPGGFA